MHNKEFDICILGLGYVGLTLAACFAKAGVRVLGVEKRQELVSMVNQGIPHFYEYGLADLVTQIVDSGYFYAVNQLSRDYSCSNYIITVGTPLDERGKARLDMIRNASLQVASHMQDEALVILRSTVKIGTARKVVKPILEGGNHSFGIAVCPERTLEGQALKELSELPQIVGADDEQTRLQASQLFSCLSQSIVQVSSLEVAEIIKLVDNTYRDTRFAFANEVARVCEAFEVSAYEVIEYGKKGYHRTNVPLPGPVGGPCLSKDPHLLMQSVASKGINLEITQACRLVNERQPQEIIQFIDHQLRQRDFAEDAAIAFLGMAFKGQPATDDLRGSMAFKLLEALNKTRPKARLRIYDPEIPAATLQHSIPSHYQACDSVDKAINQVASVIITNNHPSLCQRHPSLVKKHLLANGFIYDCWNSYSFLKQHLEGYYFAIGQRN